MTAPAATFRARLERFGPNAPRRLRPWLAVLHWRHGWLWSTGLALLACASAVEVAANRPLGEELAALNSTATISSQNTALAAAAPPPTAFRRSRDIDDVLRAQGSFETQYRQLIELASARGIELPRADYATTWEESGGVRRVQVSLSMATRYPALRSFIEEVLRTLPAVSLDQFSVKRDNVAQGQVEVLVRMSFWSLGEPLVRSGPHSASAPVGP